MRHMWDGVLPGNPFCHTFFVVTSLIFGMCRHCYVMLIVMDEVSDRIISEGCVDANFTRKPGTKSG